jgi:hypothetical protein
MRRATDPRIEPDELDTRLPRGSVQAAWHTPVRDRFVSRRSGATLARPSHVTRGFLEDDGMLRVFADGEEAHRLEGPDGTVVGWVRGRGIGFRGFGDERQAVAAAVAAWRALDAVLRRQFAGWPRHEPALDRLRVVHDGVHEWISDGHAALARLHRVDDAPRSGGSLAIELELPSFASEGIAIAAAQLVGEAIQKNVDWSGRADGASERLRSQWLSGVPT